MPVHSCTSPLPCNLAIHVPLSTAQVCQKTQQALVRFIMHHSPPNSPSPTALIPPISPYASDPRSLILSPDSSSHLIFFYVAIKYLSPPFQSLPMSPSLSPFSVNSSASSSFRTKVIPTSDVIVSASPRGHSNVLRLRSRAGGMMGHSNISFRVMCIQEARVRPRERFELST
jgi:hypothetical protein